MNWYKKSQQSRSVSDFLSGFRPSSLRGLAAEALKCNDFEEFQSEFLGQIKHGTYWHVTDNPNFSIDLNSGPRDRSSMNPTGDRPYVGKLMATSDLEHWADYYSSTREYAAELDLSALDPGEYYQVSRGFGNEFFITAPEKVRVLRVLPLEKALRAHRYRHSKLPGNSEALREFYESVRGRYRAYLEES